MNEYRHHILTRGRYQIVALTPDPQFESDDIYAYAVMSSSGLKMRQELTLTDARNWLEFWIEQERASSGGSSPDMMEPSPPGEPSKLQAVRKRR
ncbi:hypothetical protein GLA29479_2713 [Lysobacter antibioticus]|jgi:hypothetical protein|uniref:Uncharacterized protein n=1 Tax=Lysobacter antibioticus TaxID=84531 RepID=A0A0S2DY83_LYSAN|nr:hypothetical protein [Lysobacter antibioticus]ALN63579.1 hypothetical protein GLA29479_2713 [Lysobacter antibioticus]ALN80551.1 hypothetical protein LA76x_2421 [Lysobacter antibioticus]